MTAFSTRTVRELHDFVSANVHFCLFIVQSTVDLLYILVIFIALCYPLQVIINGLPCAWNILFYLSIQLCGHCICYGGFSVI